METILDIKKALEKVPDKLLDSLWFGCGEGCEGKINMVASEGSEDYDFPAIFEIINKKYPQLNEFNKLIKNIAKAQGILDKEDDEADDMDEKLQQEGVTPETFKDEEKSSPSQKELKEEDLK